MKTATKKTSKKQSEGEEQVIVRHVWAPLDAAAPAGRGRRGGDGRGGRLHRAARLFAPGLRCFPQPACADGRRSKAAGLSARAGSETQPETERRDTGEPLLGNLEEPRRV